MEKYRKKKKFGQNFLTSPAIPKKIVTQSGFDKSYGVLEIGAGQGILTEELANTVGKVVSVEIDSDLMECLSKRFGEIDNVKIINQDILETKRVFRRACPGGMRQSSVLHNDSDYHETA